jgi:hypothetical protein
MSDTGAGAEIDTTAGGGDVPSSQVTGPEVGPGGACAGGTDGDLSSSAGTVSYPMNLPDGQWLFVARWSSCSRAVRNVYADDDTNRPAVTVIDVDEQRQLADWWRITVVPTLLTIVRGQEGDRIVGPAVLGVQTGKRPRRR